MQSSDKPDAKPEHHSFQLTPERELSMRHRVARGAIIIYFVILLVSGFIMCSCPSFFAAMALCAVVAVIYGSRFQRILSVGMLVIAVTVGVIQFRQDRQRTQRTLEHLRQINELNKQRNQGQ